MKLFFRLMILLVVVPATYYFIYWVPFSFFPFIEQRWILSVTSLVGAIGIGWYVWRKLGSTQAGLVSSTLLGAVVFGAIGFCAGFFGPIVFAPEANQGPLLGIFITGPLGALFGAVFGFVYGRVSRKTKA